MNEAHINKIAAELNIKSSQVENTVKLLKEDATVPFISRYRKEMTGSLDEVQITAIRDRILQLEELDKRRDAILKSLEERELLTEELKDKIYGAETMAELEDIYLPFRPKRRTRATVAREKGLEPLAELIFAQEGCDLQKEAEKYLTPEEEKEEKEKAKLLVESAEDALAGARDIIAEWVNENQEARAKIRQLFLEKGSVTSKLLNTDEEAAAKYKDYFDWSEPIAKAPSHRILAILRGERELHLSARFAPAEADAHAILMKLFVKGSGADSEQVKGAIEDSYKRLLAPSMENEVRVEAKAKADEAAIKVFCENLRELLLASPLGEKRVLAIDPGFRTGCKVVCLDSQGKLLENHTVYLSASEEKKKAGGNIIRALCEKYKIQAIAIGNGTASRETEAFVKTLELPKDIVIVMVNESGASVYSASKTAREEFPDHDVTVRGSVSIGRRLMDPLAELVKIDPKSIGVGQYQHDVDQGKLKQGLDDVVISCVNNVGVDVNTASPQLLTYVSGLGPSIVKNIVAFREEKGAFKKREALLDVPRLGPKAFEQAAGFLRIRGGENPLDSSAVHPERYALVEQMAGDIETSVEELMKSAEARAKIDLKKYISDDIGLPTLNDIIAELEKPGRDPRKKFEAFSFSEDVEKISDLKVGMKLPGIITNVTDFGAFVDVGVHQDGLVHVSQISEKFIKNANEIVKVGQKVEVTVIEVDEPRKRISLSLKKDPFAKPPEKKERKKNVPPRGKGKGKPQQKKAEFKPRKPQPSRPEPKKFGNNPFAVLADLKKKK